MPSTSPSEAIDDAGDRHERDYHQPVEREVRFNPGGVDELGHREDDGRGEQSLAGARLTFAIATSHIGQGACTLSSISRV